MTCDDTMAACCVEQYAWLFKQQGIVVVLYKVLIQRKGSTVTPNHINSGGFVLNTLFLFWCVFSLSLHGQEIFSDR